MLGGGDFVVVLVAGQAHLDHGRNHLAADVAGDDRRRIGQNHGDAGSYPRVMGLAEATVDGLLELRDPVGELRGNAAAVGAGVDGVLTAVLVREGQTVSAGQTLALVDCRDEEARLSEARAAIEIAKQKRERLLRGSRRRLWK